MAATGPGCRRWVTAARARTPRGLSDVSNPKSINFAVCEARINGYRQSAMHCCPLPRGLGELEPDHVKLGERRSSPTAGAFARCQAVYCSGYAGSADIPSTGTMTRIPRSAAPLAVKSTAPCAAVPITMTVSIPRSLRIFSRSVLMNLSGPDWTDGSFGAAATSLTNVGGRRVRDNAVDDRCSLAAGFG